MCKLSSESRDPPADAVYLASTVISSLIQPLPSLVRLHWGWRTVELAVQSGRLSFDAPFDQAIDGVVPHPGGDPPNRTRLLGNTKIFCLNYVVIRIDGLLNSN